MMNQNMGVLYLISVNLFCFLLVTDATVINVKKFKKEPLQKAEFKPSLEGIDKFDIGKLVKSYGYPFEKHQVTTEDGYNLEIHRIPHGKEDSISEVRPVVLIMHDILGTSADFLITGPNNSLALQLAQQGYDVWLGNNRGNTYSRSHNTLKPTNKTFWDYSFHELGIYDLPAKIDYILTQTGQSNLSYVGYSQGATQFFVMLSEKPEYNKNVTLMTALAPLVYMKNVNHLLFKLLSHQLGLIEFVEKQFNISEVLSHDFLITLAGNFLCQEKSAFREACSFVASAFLGIDQKLIDGAMLANLLKVFPGGSSLKEFKHYAQGISSGEFRNYNYGILGNREKYGKLMPPAYAVKSVTVPVALFYGKNDWLVNVSDEKQLADELPNVVHNFEVENENFNHGDFIFSKQARAVLNFHVINTLNKYNNMPEVTTEISSTITTPVTQSSEITTPSQATTPVTQPSEITTPSQATTPVTQPSEITTPSQGTTPQGPSSDSSSSPSPGTGATSPSSPITTPGSSYSFTISPSPSVVFIHLLLAGFFSAMTRYC